MERDPVRGGDALATFREILELARKEQADFVLLAGDLFHDNKPSRPTMYKTMALLREYTMGDDPVTMELLSDPYTPGAPAAFPSINYEDANLNVSMPVFCIHGNHDDPQGVGEDGSLSALDVLSAAGLLNYFGQVRLPSASHTRKRRADDAADGLIPLRPILLRKGDTRIALYGLGNLKDERLTHELRERHVCMYRPAEDTDAWFNILALHQNRTHGYVPESMLDDSLHLVVWGHEHEQRIQPEAVAEKNYYISQPGSTVATSLSPGELAPKCAAIVTVRGRDFRIESVPLTTVRPFVMHDMDLTVAAAAAQADVTDRVAVTKLLRSQVEALVERAQQQWASSPHGAGTAMPLPLVRLRVTYDTQIPIGNLARFGQAFVGRVANPKEVLQLQMRRQRRAPAASASLVPTEPGMMAAEKLERVNLSSLVRNNVQRQHFDLLNVSQLQHSVMNFVEKEERDAIETFLSTTLATVERQLQSAHVQESQLQAALEQIRHQHLRSDDHDAAFSEEDVEAAPRGEGADAARTGDDEPRPPPPPAVRRRETARAPRAATPLSDAPISPPRGTRPASPMSVSSGSEYEPPAGVTAGRALSLSPTPPRPAAPRETSRALPRRPRAAAAPPTPSSRAAVLGGARARPAGAAPPPPISTRSPGRRRRPADSSQF